MAETHGLAATKRSGSGTGAARATRREGRVPAIIYGGDGDAESIAIEANLLDRELRKPSFFGTLLDVEIEGAKTRVLPRDVQHHPVTDAPLHVDFLRVTENTQINVDVAVEFINEEQSPGLVGGGVLNVVRFEVEVICRAGSIPENLVVDLTGTEVGDSIHISAVPLPDGVRPAEDRDFTVATLVAPTIEVEPEEPEDAEGEEGEEGEGEEGEESEGEEGEGEKDGGKED
ncbi:MAG: 50S ribosomal protein L25/general stress protein Ctc [Rhodospirillaceae bacterium]|jgi:large subunit ribosomal protein L25|nr:50S ribosomal protein L25/general stress protein Ctc [Rhodospirillaceae bacterium]MBT6116988.1 50S ribosomal protein L25/general stress protein Ctc [Rhodospirillaceae bacterium]